MASPLDAVVSLVTPPLVSQVAGRLGEPEPNVSRGLRTSLTAPLAALAGHPGNERLTRTVSDLASRFSADPSAGSPAERRDATSAAPAAARSPITGLIASLSDGSTGGAGDAIARATGVRASSASTTLSLPTPLVLRLLDRRTREGGLEGSGLAGMLGAERGAPGAATRRGDAPRAEPPAHRLLRDTEQDGRGGGRCEQRDGRHDGAGAFDRRPAHRQRG